MPYNVNTLKTRPQCVAAKASLEAELDGYDNRDRNLAFQDRREERAEVSTTTRLTTATSRVTYLTDQLARPDLSPADRRSYDDQLLTATYQKARLQNRATDSEGTATFLAEVDADQVETQVVLLTQAISDVQQRHDELPA